MQHQSWIKNATQRIAILEDRTAANMSNTSGQYLLSALQPLSTENDAVECEDMFHIKAIPGQSGSEFMKYFGTMDQVEKQLRRDDQYFYSIQFHSLGGIWGEGDGFSGDYRLVCDDLDWSRSPQRFPEHNK